MMSCTRQRHLYHLLRKTHFMQKTITAANIRKLHIQAAAISEQAEREEDPNKRKALMDGAGTVRSLADSHERKAKADIPVLPANATQEEIRKVRLYSAVRVGDELFLPFAKTGCVAIPNILVRSALFSASNAKRGALTDERFEYLQNTSLIVNGPALSSYDRKIYAACLNHYQNHDLPLCQSDGSRWEPLSCYQLARTIGISYGSKVHKAIRDSLKRLSLVQIQLRIDSHDLPLLRLIEFDEGSKTTMDEINEKQKGGTTFSFRILEETARLFCYAAWSFLPLKVLREHSGLTAWLAAFYNTHKRPFGYPVSRLYELAGATCCTSEFRRMLRNSFQVLQKENVDAMVRVKKCDWSGDSIKVHLHRWGT